MSDKQTPVSAKLYIDIVIAAGAWVWICAGLQHSFRNGALFWACLLVGLFAATLKVRLPGVEGTFSLGFVGSLVAIQELDFAEAVVVGTLVGVTQSLWRPSRRPLAIQVAFNAANVAISTAVAYGAYRGGLLNDSSNSCALLLLSAATLFYVVNTGTVAGVLCLLEHKSLNCMVEHWCLWSFSYYLAGALLALFVQSIAGLPLVPLVLLPLLFIANILYRGYVGCLAESDPDDQSLTDDAKYHLYGR
jgi:hypothetical protein